MAANSPGRPPNINDLTMGLNGTWKFLGQIVATSTPKDNGNTTTPFFATPKSDADPNTGKRANYEGTLTGRTLILQAMDNAFLVQVAQADQLPGGVGGLRLNPVTAASGANPGLRFGVGERPSFVMGPTQGFLQVISETGTATVSVWELT